jgi:ATP/maltotriose-dependent transcriptional regulator MalT/DNA-binding SARP family transcriptional activator
MEDLGVSVESGIGDRLLDRIAVVRPCFPLRPGKVERPCLPDETLPRDRLFEWLVARSNRRVIYVTAEAGFGKTTLVADFLRRSRLRTFWYRLDEDDTDGLVFLRYLVAACQAVDTRLLARSAALLSESSPEPTGQDAVLETLLKEIQGLGEMPSALVLDDFHVVESVPAIAAVLERFIARAPAGLQVIVAGRRTPSLSVAALRARGELAELVREDLRFDESETGRLFRDAYRHPLEPDVLRDLQTRTDGWAASLHLVKTAVDGRSPCQVRAFVNSLSGADGDLYDYLAEEVVGDLDPGLRDFLVRASILDDIDPGIAAVAVGISPVRARALLYKAQRLGLMSRGADKGGAWRPHPLVREFLFAHLEAELGEDGVAEMHRRLATIAEPLSWRLAAHHWAAAGDAEEVRRVICKATPTIIGTGDLAAAAEFITRFPDPNPNPWFDVIRIRSQFALGRCEEALAEARRLQQTGLTSSDTTLSSTVASTLLTLGIELDDLELRLKAAEVLPGSHDRELASIAMATDAVYRAAEDGSLDYLRGQLLKTLGLNQERGHLRHQGISLVNLANMEICQRNPHAAITAATEALRILRSAGSRGDIASAHINVARGLAYLGQWEEAQLHVKHAAEGFEKDVEPEVFGEAAELEAMFGDPARGVSILSRAFSESERGRDDHFCRYVAARIALQHAKPDVAGNLLTQIEGQAWIPGFRSARLSLDLQIRAMANLADPELPAAFEGALSFASNQQAWFWWKNIGLTQALASLGDHLTHHFRSLEPEDAALLSIQAELVLSRIADLDEAGFALVRAEASLRPERWRWALRRFLATGGHRPPEIRRAAELLEIVGDVEDIALLAPLRKKRALRLPDAGRALARHLAPRVYVEDLARVSVRIGDRVVCGTDIRKKVLSLLCFLLTRSQFTATREQVFEALWPEMDPEAGANSLNQSAYFLRRVIEPDCEDETTAGYLRSRADLIWLDHELVNSRSSDCLKLIEAIRRDSSPALVTKLAESYPGRFAVDFIYDDWASSFRDTLHASFLDRVERAVASDMKAGAFDRALSVAQLALNADPEAEQIELCLLRLYRRMGANAAAAEQYAHYAGVLREQLGVEPPPLESL